MIWYNDTMTQWYNDNDMSYKIFGPDALLISVQIIALKEVYNI